MLLVSDRDKGGGKDNDRADVGETNPGKNVYQHDRNLIKLLHCTRPLIGILWTFFRPFKRCLVIFSMNEYS